MDFPDALYLHIPFCRRRCAYCSFVSFSGREELIPRYLRALENEISLRGGHNLPLGSVYIGGGTPSLLAPHQIGSLLAAVKANFKLAEGAEISLEANPGTVDIDYLRAVRASGINRLSLGIQSLDQRELSLLGRIHTRGGALEVVHLAAEAGFESISLDFIYGVPGRNLETWRGMLADIIELPVVHLSLYALTLEENTPLGCEVSSGRLAAVPEEAVADEYEIAVEMLAEAGFRQYEISNWAKAGAECRHNLVYWQRQPYLGVGVAAHSFDGDNRQANISSLDEYLAALEEGSLPPVTVDTIDPDSALGEAVMLGLRLNRGIAVDDIQRRFKVNLMHRFSAEIAELTALGLLETGEGRLRLTLRGRMLGNEVFMRFLP
jgi:oxygen-independent coproporphyrinogen-3 oxidase